MQTIPRSIWQQRARAHRARLAPYVEPHLERRRAGERHPVHDFLFEYYSYRPAALYRWHPGYGVGLEGATEYAGSKGYAGEPATVTAEHLRSQHGLIVRLREVLAATASRAPTLGCLGLHEWAMVYRTDAPRHDWPLRLGTAGTDAVVEGHRIGCSHFDAYRFFTDAARPLNTLRPGRDDRPAFEQPGCLHTGMDLYKTSFRLGPLICSDLVADCFALAWDIRELDMRASPYDFSALGYAPVPIETPEGKREFVEQQRAFADRGAPLRACLIAECDRLLGAVDSL